MLLEQMMAQLILGFEIFTYIIIKKVSISWCLEIIRACASKSTVKV